MASCKFKKCDGECLLINMLRSLLLMLVALGREAQAYNAANWAKANSFPVNTTSNGVGIPFIEFTKSSGTPGGATDDMQIYSDRLNNI